MCQCGTAPPPRVTGAPVLESIMGLVGNLRFGSKRRLLEITLEQMVESISGHLEIFAQCRSSQCRDPEVEMGLSFCPNVTGHNECGGRGGTDG